MTAGSVFHVRTFQKQHLLVSEDKVQFFISKITDENSLKLFTDVAIYNRVSKKSHLWLAITLTHMNGF